MEIVGKVLFGWCFMMVDEIVDMVVFLLLDCVLYMMG